MLRGTKTLKKEKKKKTRAKSSYGTCDEIGRAKRQELIWHELWQNSKNQQIALKGKSEA